MINEPEFVPMFNEEERNRIVWDTFLSLKQTLPTEKRDYREWHRGRKEYAVWTVRIQSTPVQSRFDAARAHLSEFLLEPDGRQSHMTLFVCGFLEDIKRWDDDYPVVELEQHLLELKEARLAPFEIEVGRANSFEAAPFIEVYDVEGGIKRVRNVLLDTSSEIREEEYVPHLTLGLYSDYFGTKAVAEKISSFRPDRRIVYCVDEISLMTYSAFEIAGLLTTKYAVHLGAT